jgi:hypothetical protein
MTIAERLEIKKRRNFTSVANTSWISEFIRVKIQEKNLEKVSFVLQ